MYTMKPTPVPISEIRPAVRPWLMLRDTRYIMFGPGVSTIPNAVTAMPSAAPVEISMRESSQPGPMRILKPSTSDDSATWITRPMDEHPVRASARGRRTPSATGFSARAGTLRS
jgi:hypothetical protein